MDTPPPPSDDPRRDPPRPWGVADAAVAPDPAAEEDTSLGINWAENRALLLVLFLIGGTFLIQVAIRKFGPGLEVELQGAVSRQALAEGRWWSLFTGMFMHAGLLHLFMNLSALLPFGMILGQRLGPGFGGQAKWLAFYLGAGLSGDLAWLYINAAEAGPMVGASGAIFGLWGAITRLNREGDVYPLFSRAVARQMTAPIIANVIVAVAFGVMGGMGGEVAGIAWQAHLGGFLFGLLTIGFFLPRRQA